MSCKWTIQTFNILLLNIDVFNIPYKFDNDVNELFPREECDKVLIEYESVKEQFLKEHDVT